MWIYPHKQMKRVDISIEANHVEVVTLLIRNEVSK